MHERGPSWRTNPTQLEIEEIRKLWNDEGLTATEIGRRVGRSRNSIVGIVHRNGFTKRCEGSRKRTIPPETRREIVAMRKTGMSYREIASREGVSEKGVQHICQPLRLGAEARRYGNEVRVSVKRKANPKASPKRAPQPPVPPQAGPREPEPLPPPEAILEPLAVPGPGRVCQYIRAEGRPWHICGRPVTIRLDGTPSSWCAHHHRVCMTVRRDVRVLAPS